MDQYILGICYYYDSAAALLKNGEIIAAAQERFSRKKYDSRFPRMQFHTPEVTGINLSDIKEVVYYENLSQPLNASRDLFGCSAKGWQVFVAAMQVWLKEKSF